MSGPFILIFGGIGEGCTFWCCLILTFWFLEISPAHGGCAKGFRAQRAHKRLLKG